MEHEEGLEACRQGEWVSILVQSSPARSFRSRALDRNSPPTRETALNRRPELRASFAEASNASRESCSPSSNSLSPARPSSTSTSTNREERA